MNWSKDCVYYSQREADGLRRKQGTAPRSSQPLSNFMDGIMMKKPLSVLFTNNESLAKNFFVSIGHFILIASAIKLALDNIPHESALTQLVLAMFLLGMLFYAQIFFVLNVVRRLVQFFYPRFKVPGIDSGAQRVPFKELITRPDIFLFGILITLFIPWLTQFVRLLK